MNNIILSFKVVFPLLIYMSLGYFLRQKKFLCDSTISEMNRVVYKIFIPVTLFMNVLGSNIDIEFDLSVLLFAIISVITLFLILCFVITKFEHNKKNASVIIQGIYRSNFVLFGITVTSSICGSNNLGMTSIIATFIVPIFNILAVILFEVFRGGKINYKNVIKGIITNPLIIASILGVIVLVLKINIHEIILIPLESINNITTPFALIILGSTFKFNGLFKYGKSLLLATFGKLIIAPCIFVSIAIFMGFRGSNLVSLMVLFASPTSVSSFSMADNMGGNGELAAYIVVTTSTVAILSIFAWTFTLSSLGFI